MINLIPREERKKIGNSFYYKAAILFVFVLGFSVLVFCIAILPTYFLSFARVNAMNLRLENQKTEPTPELNKATALLIKDINNKLDIVEKTENDKFVFSERVIKAILANKTPQIRITEIYYNSVDSTKGAKVGINGTAPSREVLLLFRQALEEDPSFKQVDLPISNFIKGSDIQFYLSLIPS